MRLSIIGKENAWEARGVEGKRVELIKSLIYARWKDTRLRRGCQIELDLSADIHKTTTAAVLNLFKFSLLWRLKNWSAPEELEQGKVVKNNCTRDNI